MKKRLGEQPIAADVAWLRVLLGKCGLAQPGGWLPFSVYQCAPHNMSASPLHPFSVSLSRAMVLRTWTQSLYVANPNDDSNYWTIRLRSWALGTTIHSFDTSGSGGGLALVFQSGAIDYGATVAGDRGLYIEVLKTGSPGGLYLFGPAVFAT